jgi:hypothetical protein
MPASDRTAAPSLLDCRGFLIGAGAAGAMPGTAGGVAAHRKLIIGSIRDNIRPDMRVACAMVGVRRC